MSDQPNSGYDPEDPRGDPTSHDPDAGRPDSPDRDETHEEAVEERTDAAPPTPLTQQVGRVTVVVLAALFGIFAVVNAQPVDFSWIFGRTEVVTGPGGERVSGGVPLIVLLVVSFALGAAIGILLTRRSRRRRREGR